MSSERLFAATLFRDVVDKYPINVVGEKTTFGTSPSNNVTPAMSPGVVSGLEVERAHIFGPEPCLSFLVEESLRILYLSLILLKGLIILS